MATRIFARSLLTRQTLSSAFARSYTSLPASTPPSSVSSLSTSFLLRLRPLVAVSTSFCQLVPPATTRGFATRQTSSSLNDPNPNWSNRPPKETILLDGCDFEHWLVVMEKPEGEPTRDEIIDSYIKTLATVVGSEEEARMKIYSVSTRHYFAFGALVSEELSYKIKELPKVRWVLPDSYLNVRDKDYGGEPFINGQAVPYDPKYHEEWVRNNARATERNRRNDRPRNNDRSRNFERRRANTQSYPGQGIQNPIPNMGGGPPGNMGGGPPGNMVGGPPGNMGGPSNMGGGPPGNMVGGPPGNMGGPSNMGGGPPGNMGGGPPGHMGGPPNMGGGSPGYMGGGPTGHMGGPPNMGGGPPNWGGVQPNNMGGGPPNWGGGGVQSNNMGGGPPNWGGVQPNMGGTPNNAPNLQYMNRTSNEGTPYQNRDMPGQVPNREYQNSNAPNMAGGDPYQTQNMPGRDAPPPPNYQ